MYHSHRMAEVELNLLTWVLVYDNTQPLPDGLKFSSPSGHNWHLLLRCPSKLRTQRIPRTWYASLILGHKEIIFHLLVGSTGQMTLYDSFHSHPVWGRHSCKLSSENYHPEGKKLHFTSSEPSLGESKTHWGKVRVPFQLQSSQPCNWLVFNAMLAEWHI